MIASGEQLAVLVDTHRDAECRCARSTEFGRALSRVQGVVLGSAAIHREQRRGFGEAINLNEFPTQFGFDPFNGARRGRRTRHNHACAAVPRNRTIPRGGSIKNRRHYCRSTAHHRHAMGFNPTQNFCTIHFAQHHMLATHARHRIRHTPAIAMKHRQRMQQHITIGDASLPTKRGGVEPDVAMRELHTFGPCRGATRVVDRGRCIFVGSVPRRWLAGVVVQLGIGFFTNDEAMLCRDAAQGFFKFGVDEQHRGTRMLDDVLHFICVQAKIDRHKHTAVATDTKK